MMRTAMPDRFNPALLFLAAVIFAFGTAGCDRHAVEEALSAGPSNTAAQTSDDDTAPVSDVTVEACVAALESLFGENGCVAGLLSAERIERACVDYMAWSEKGRDCGAQALADFYACLGTIDCAAFDDPDGDERDEFPEEYTRCQRQFASDMDPCVSVED
ncbi:MAG: hypothetical protein M5R36_19560 [Deltaproteobacteria bacterium]|nr:hypothetical protein [Deltaproteobacteria bacterium]